MKVKPVMKPEPKRESPTATNERLFPALYQFDTEGKRS